MRKSLFSFEDLDFSEFIKPYEDFQKDYESILRKNKSRKRAFKVIFKDQPDLLYLTFSKSRDKAKGEAVTYFKNNFHPAFIGRSWRNEFGQARAYQVPELDKYSKEGKVPVPDLMKYLDASFCCSVCGNHTFKYSDYENGRCFVIEGEGDINEITKGIVVCYDCHRKYFK